MGKKYNCLICGCKCIATGEVSRKPFAKCCDECEEQAKKPCPILQDLQYIEISAAVQPDLFLDGAE